MSLSQIQCCNYVNLPGLAEYVLQREEIMMLHWGQR